jgi:hypothetical protein
MREDMTEQINRVSPTEFNKLLECVVPAGFDEGDLPVRETNLLTHQVLIELQNKGNDNIEWDYHKALTDQIKAYKRHVLGAKLPDYVF